MRRHDRNDEQPSDHEQGDREATRPVDRELAAYEGSIRVVDPIGRYVQDVVEHVARCGHARGGERREGDRPPKRKGERNAGPRRREPADDRPGERDPDVPDPNEAQDRRHGFGGATARL